MEDIILVYFSTDHTFESATDTIGREGEVNTSRFEIDIPERLINCSVYLDFEKPNGEKFRSPKLEVENGVAVYDVVPFLLTDDGEMFVQAVLITEKGKIWKSSIKRYAVHKSINSLEEIPEAYSCLEDMFAREIIREQAEEERKQAEEERKQAEEERKQAENERKELARGDDGVGISKIEKTSTSGTKDTYTVTYTDGTTSTFTVTNGHTPYIGENGNWWIDATDTGIRALVFRYGTEDLIAGTSALETGRVYFVYE